MSIKGFTSSIFNSALKRCAPSICRMLIFRNAEYAAFLPQMYVRIETTNACNAECDFCTHKELKRKTGFMDYDLSAKIVDECARLKINTIWFIGFGEPLMDKLLEKRIRYAKNAGIRTTAISTNGQLLDKNRAQGLIDSGLDEINISLDADSKENYEKRRLKLNYEIVINNLEGVLSLKKSSGIIKPKITLSFVRDENYRREAEEFIKKWQPRVDAINVSAMHNWGKDHKGIRRKYSIPCYRLWFTFVIQCDGLVSLCCADTQGEFILGDMNKSSVEKIWNNDAYRNIRRNNLKLLNSANSICSKCSLTDRDSLSWLTKLFRGKNA